MSFNKAIFFYKLKNEYAQDHFLTSQAWFTLILKLGFVLLLVAQAVIVAKQFNWLFVDADQLVIAEQAKWLSRGLIFEPNFYGQSYLTPLDAYIGALLVFIGLKPLLAVQVCNIFFFCSGFAIVALLTKKRSSIIIIALSVLVILLPYKYFIVAQMARAFTTITSLTCCALAFYIFGQTECEKKHKHFLGIIVGFCMGSFTGAFLLLPAILLIESKANLLKFSAFFVLGFLLSKGTSVFYALNPEFIVHHQSPVNFSTSDFFQNWQNSAIRTPLLKLVCPGLVIVSLLQLFYVGLTPLKHLRVGFVLFGFVTILVLMLSTQKIRDFSPGSPFYAVERMFIAIPFFFALILAYLAVSRDLNSRPQFNSQRFNAFLGSRRLPLIGALFFFFAVSVYNLNRDILKNRESLISSPTPAVATSLQKLTQECGKLRQRTTELTQGYLFLVERNDTLNYGCSALFDIKIVQADYERRTWLKEYYEEKGFRKIEYNHNN